MPLRFEVVGMMSGSVVSTETLHVLNLGVSGALVEGGAAAAQNAEYQMQLVLESHVSEATVKIRRVTRSQGRSAALSHRPRVSAISREAEVESTAL